MLSQSKDITTFRLVLYYKDCQHKNDASKFIVKPIIYHNMHYFLFISNKLLLEILLVKDKFCLI